MHHAGDRVERKGRMMAGDHLCREQAECLAQVLGCGAVEVHAIGGETRTYRIGGTDDLVTVSLDWPLKMTSPADLSRRVEMQRRIGDRVSVPVPNVVRVRDDFGLVVIRLLDGTRLIDLPAIRRSDFGPVVAREIGTLLGQLHTADPDSYAALVPVDDYSPDEWKYEAAELAEVLGTVLDAEQRSDVRRFLTMPPPASASRLVLSHNDLGIEHVLVSSASPAAPNQRVTGVIDWDDAAITDPAYDFGLLLRDLGPAALDIALGAYARTGATAEGVVERGAFYAACKLLEDLAFGHEQDRPEYVEKSLGAWTWTFCAAGT